MAASVAAVPWGTRWVHDLPAAILARMDVPERYSRLYSGMGHTLMSVMRREVISSLVNTAWKGGRMRYIISTHFLWLLRSGIICMATRSISAASSDPVIMDLRSWAVYGLEGSRALLELPIPRRTLSVLPSAYRRACRCPK